MTDAYDLAASCEKLADELRDLRRQLAALTLTDFDRSVLVTMRDATMDIAAQRLIDRLLDVGNPTAITEVIPRETVAHLRQLSKEPES